MAFHAARLDTRTDGSGNLVVLEDQDPRHWDRALMTLGFTALDQSSAGDELTEYHRQAAIAAQHARAAFGMPTDWAAILREYDGLLALTPTPVVLLNRAVAVARVHGPQTALECLAPLGRDRTLARYYLLPAVEGHLWAEVGDRERAGGCFREALSRPCSEPEKRFLRERLARVEDSIE